MLARAVAGEIGSGPHATSHAANASNRYSWVGHDSTRQKVARSHFGQPHAPRLRQRCDAGPIRTLRNTRRLPAALQASQRWCAGILRRLRLLCLAGFAPAGQKEEGKGWQSAGLPRRPQARKLPKAQESEKLVHYLNGVHSGYLCSFAYRLWRGRGGQSAGHTPSNHL